MSAMPASTSQRSYALENTAGSTSQEKSSGSNQQFQWPTSIIGMSSRAEKILEDILAIVQVPKVRLRSNSQIARSKSPIPRRRQRPDTEVQTSDYERQPIFQESKGSRHTFTENELVRAANAHWNKETVLKQPARKIPLGCAHKSVDGRRVCFAFNSDEGCSKTKQGLERDCGWHICGIRPFGGAHTMTNYCNKGNNNLRFTALDGRRLCPAFNSNEGCARSRPGQECEHGWHICGIKFCGGPHSQVNCYNGGNPNLQR